VFEYIFTYSQVLVNIQPWLRLGCAGIHWAGLGLDWLGLLVVLTSVGIESEPVFVVTKL